MRSNKAIKPFTDRLLWPLDGVHLNLFVVASGLQLSVDFKSTHEATCDNLSNVVLNFTNYLFPLLFLVLLFSPLSDGGMINTV